MSKRLDVEDTVDVALHFLQKLQAEGWGVSSVSCDFDHYPAGKRRIPVEATLTVRLVPSRP